MTEQPENSSPPKWADKLLKVFLPEDLAEELQGDMHEQFEVQVEEMGLTKAQWLYVWEVLRFCRPYFLKRKFKKNTNYSDPVSIFSLIMIRNYFKIALRHLWQNKAFTSINLLGLTIGTSCCLYMLLYIRSQYGYDEHHVAPQQLYRVTTEVTESGGQPFAMALTSPPIAKGLKEDFGEVAAVTRLFKDPGAERFLLKKENDAFYETKGYYADSSFFQLFNYRFIEGSPNRALNEPLTVVLSSKTAQKLFGSQAALNQSIKINNDLYRITGVYDDANVKSHINAHFIMSFKAGGMIEYLRTSNQWVGMNLVNTYIRLKPNTDAEKLQAKLSPFLERHAKEQLAQVGIRKALFLQPVTDVHLYSNLDSELEKNIEGTFIRTLLLIAILIQVMACINFMNMSTARSIGRAKEVGVRKVMGATRLSLAGRFVGESVLMVSLSILLALPLVWLLMPVLNSLLDAEISITLSLIGDLFAISGMLIVITGLLASIYPAFYLSAYQAIAVLKGNFQNRYNSLSIRKSLVVAQFVISVILLTGIIVITRQLNVFKNRDLGFEQTQKVIIPFTTKEASIHQVAFSNELRSSPAVKQVGGAAYYPCHWLGENMPLFYYPSANREKIGAGVWVNKIDENFLSTLHIPLIAGRNLAPADTNRQIIVNETTLREFAIPFKKAIGTRLFLEYQKIQEEYTIVGVVKDFNYRTLKEPLRPLMLKIAKPDQLKYLIADVDNVALDDFKEQISEKWRKLIPTIPFESTLLDDDIQQQYVAENTLLNIINSSAFIAFLIACLGLFGLATFTAEQRTKEVGIRKVLGASVSSLVALLSKEFLQLVGIAIIIAIPIAWYALNEWLKNFAYHIDLEWWMFALAGLLAIFIALATVSFQAIKAALVNPVKSLKSE
ncbi:ABC transporter permease [Emticicia sp. BO119]|uniref:ABC transporter permease n=1 Tax=Emticicia sp. BO119 TaxID=2757768 RepID=UPI0015F07F1A|nr:ABC transporter permease [Emticicia sp. BO119]MBA4849339.1 ABC transporter permease [Emticicia sp. BO119]